MILLIVTQYGVKETTEHFLKNSYDCERIRDDPKKVLPAG